MRARAAVRHRETQSSCSSLSRARVSYEVRDDRYFARELSILSVPCVHILLRAFNGTEFRLSRPSLNKQCRFIVQYRSELNRMLFIAFTHCACFVLFYTLFSTEIFSCT